MDRVIKDKLEKWVQDNQQRIIKGEYFEALALGLDITDYQLYRNAINLLVETGVPFKEIFKEIPLVDSRVIDYEITHDPKTRNIKLWIQFEEIKDVRIEMLVRYFIPITTYDITPFMQIIKNDTGYIQLTPVPDQRYIISIDNRPQLIATLINSPREAEDIFAEILDDWLIDKYKTYVVQNKILED